MRAAAASSLQFNSPIFFTAFFRGFSCAVLSISLTFVSLHISQKWIRLSITTGFHVHMATLNLLPNSGSPPVAQNSAPHGEGPELSPPRGLLFLSFILVSDRIAVIVQSLFSVWTKLAVKTSFKKGNQAWLIWKYPSSHVFICVKPYILDRNQRRRPFHIKIGKSIFLFVWKRFNKGLQKKLFNWCKAIWKTESFCLKLSDLGPEINLLSC